jgi:hypothetical protein
MPSFVWGHFTKVDESYACCKDNGCNTTILCRKGTSGLINHLFGDESTTTNSQGEPFVQDPEHSTMSLHEQLKRSLGSVRPGPSQTNEVEDVFKKEFDYFDCHKVRDALLEKIYDAVCSSQSKRKLKAKETSL